MDFYDNDPKLTGNEQYSGPERRKIQRRHTEDRRDGIRLELDNPPRRSGKDRRSHTYLWNTPQQY